ncbi:MAG: hypothetical protein ACHQM6_10470, partial [Candidatus Kapaibacterium sp.]
MKKIPKATICACIAFLTVSISPPLQAQWSLIAPNLLGIQEIETGAITHKSGITWAGSLKLLF